jgi:hypothetical protein
MNSANIMGSFVSIRAVHAAILQPPPVHSNALHNVLTSHRDEQHNQLTPQMQPELINGALNS